LDKSGSKILHYYTKLHVITRNHTQKLSGSLVMPSEGFSFKHFNSNEVEKAIAALGNNSSSGIADIPVKVIKHCSGVLSPILASLFNHFIDTGDIPHD
jgi:hypothetical protein